MYTPLPLQLHSTQPISIVRSQIQAISQDHSFPGLEYLEQRSKTPLQWLMGLIWLGAFTLSVICFSFSFFIHHRAEQSVEGKFKCRARKKVHSNLISITKSSQFQAKIVITFWSHNYNFEMEMWDFYYIFFLKMRYFHHKIITFGPKSFHH